MFSDFLTPAFHSDTNISLASLSAYAAMSGSKTGGWPTHSRTTSVRCLRRIRYATPLQSFQGDSLADRNMHGTRNSLSPLCPTLLESHRSTHLKLRQEYMSIHETIPATPAAGALPTHSSCVQIKCLSGVAEATLHNAVAQNKPKDFDEWIMRVMGRGIARPVHAPLQLQGALCLPWSVTGKSLQT